MTKKYRDHLIDGTSNNPLNIDPGCFSERVLIVFEAVAIYGPCTAVTLEKFLSIPRVSIWRALKVLERSNWIRLSKSDNYYEVSPQFAELVSRTNFSFPEAAEGDIIVSAIKSIGDFRLRIGVLTGAATFFYLEPISYVPDDQADLSPVFGLAPVAAQLGATHAEIERFMRLYIKSGRATSDEKVHIENGQHMLDLVNLAKNGYIRNHGRSEEIALPIRFSNGTPGSIVISSKNSTKSGIAELERCLGLLLPILSEDNSKHILEPMVSKGSRESAKLNVDSYSSCPLSPSSAVWHRKLFEKITEKYEDSIPPLSSVANKTPAELRVSKFHQSIPEILKGI